LSTNLNSINYETKFLHVYAVTPPPVPSETAKPAVSEKPAAAPNPATKKVTNLDNEQEFRDLELSNMRRTIAKRLTQSKVGFLKFNVIKVKFELLFIFIDRNSACL
jgi:pyruvate/2-oxoglutarate dehydrogenase complex dihydrolipoamide acyltransferase (E2) component